MTPLDFGAYVSAVTLVTVWLLYPLVMGALAGLVRRRVRTAAARLEPAARSVSVVIATRDDPAVVGARVEDCLKATNVPAPIEVIVALDRRCAWESIETSGTPRALLRRAAIARLRRRSRADLSRSSLVHGSRSRDD